MARKKLRLIKYTVPAVILSAIFLAFLSFKSIRSTAEANRQNYFRNIDQTHEELTSSLRKNRDELNQYLQTLALNAESGQLQLSSKDSSGNNWPFPKGVFLFNRHTLTYPFLALNAPPDVPTMPRPDSVEDFFLNLENQVGPEIAIQQREAHLDTVQGRFRQGLHYFALARLYNTQKKFLKALEMTSKFISLEERSPRLRPLAPHLWIFRIKLLVRHASPSKSMYEMNSLLSYYRQNSNRYNIDQARYAWDMMFSEILSIATLSKIVRQRVWKQRTYLMNHLDHSRIYNQHLKTFRGHISMNALSSGYNYVHSEDKIIVFHRYSEGAGKKYIAAVFDRREYYQAAIQSFRPQRKSLKNGQFILWNDNKLLYNQKRNDSLIAYREFCLDTPAPIRCVTSYRRSDNSLKKDFNRRVLLLSILLGVTLYILFLGSFYLWRSLRRERRLLHMKSNFLSAVTHELKTPLTSIRMFAETMKGGRIKDPAKYEQYAQLIFDESTRLHGLIEDVLTYSRLDKGDFDKEKVSIDLHDLVRNIIQRLEVQAQAKSIEVKSQLDSPCKIMGDLRSIESLVINLIENAIKYSPENTIVRVELLNKSDYIHFNVHDQGVGISPAEQRRVFDVFYRTGDELTRNTKGSGLGLAIVKQVVDLHSGQISLKSVKNKGTSFMVRLPGEQSNES